MPGVSASDVLSLPYFWLHLLEPFLRPPGELALRKLPGDLLVKLPGMGRVVLPLLEVGQLEEVFRLGAGAALQGEKRQAAGQKKD